MIGIVPFAVEKRLTERSGVSAVTESTKESMNKKIIFLTVLLSGCAGSLPSRDACINWQYDVCHCRGDATKTVWWPEPPSWEEIYEACEGRR